MRRSGLRRALRRALGRALAGAMGWLLAYMQFNDMAVKWVTSASQSPLVVLLVFAVVMVVLGTFVDSLAILLVFAPVAVELSKRYGIDPIQMGLVMVICNQIGAVSPPTAPLLFVTTNIAHMRHDIPDALWGELKHEGLIRADAPTP